MIKILKNIKLNNFSKKLILITLDLVIIIFSVFLSYSLRLDYIYPPLDIDFIIYLIFIVVIIYNFYLNNIYQILISFFDNQSILKIIRVVLISQVILFIINIILHKTFFFPRSISIIAPVVSCILFVLMRVILNYLINSDNSKRNNTNNILIYGINANTFSLLKNLRNYPNYGKVVAFVDAKDRYKKRELSGIKIFKNIDLKNVIDNYQITEIIINNKSLSKKKVENLYNKFEKQNIRIRNLTSSKNSLNFLNKSLETKPSFFDIINRPKIIVDNKILNKKIKGKNILITGGGGSIGSELCIEILKHEPKKIYVLEIAEINLFNLIEKIKKEKKYNSNVLIPILGDCSDKKFLINKFKKLKIDDLFHAAAYKHVNFGEENPYSMIKNNIFGTNTIVEFAIYKKIKNFIFISSDKAVNPKSILGFSKKMGEELIKNTHFKIKNDFKTVFTIVRFGNVIGSSGSVIPIFLNQISEMSALTVTSKKVTRYFMSISEAVQLVINASYFNRKGVKIFALDMGKQLNIYEMAKRIIRLSGLSIKNKKDSKGDIKIKIIGLKKGEKISEEVTLGKNLVKTSHPQIMICNENLENKSFGKKMKNIKEILDRPNIDNRTLKNVLMKNL